MADQEYQEIKCLKEGAQGATRLLKGLSDNQLLVVKEYKKQAWQLHGVVPREYFILRELLKSRRGTEFHRGIIRCGKQSQLSSVLGIMRMSFEYCEGGDLLQFIKPKGGQSEEFIWNVFVQMADALAWLHYGMDRKLDKLDKRPLNTYGWKRVVHADVKPANIFCRRVYKDGDVLPSLVLGDFGLAFWDKDNNLPNHNYGGGSPMFHGPEWPFVSAKTDVWGLGATIHALAHGPGHMVPLPEAQRKKVISLPKAQQGNALRIAHEAWEENGDSKIPRHLGKNYSTVLDKCMMRCLETMDERINSGELVRLLVKEEAMWKKAQDKRERHERAREVKDQERQKQEAREQKEQELEAQQLISRRLKRLELEEREKDILEADCHEEDRRRQQTIGYTEDTELVRHKHRRHKEHKQHR